MCSALRPFQVDIPERVPRVGTFLVADRDRLQAAEHKLRHALLLSERIFASGDGLRLHLKSCTACRRKLASLDI